MGRLGGIAVACSITFSSITSGVAPATAKQPSMPVLARIARGLAAIIREDARRGGPAATTAVKVQTRCCARRIITVYYRAQHGEYSPYGTYELVLETEHDVVQAVMVAELPSTAENAFGAKSSLNPTFSLSVRQTLRSPFSRWSGSVSYDYNHCPFLPPPPSPLAPHYCTAAGSGVILTESANAAALYALFKEASTVMYKARHHEPISTENSSVLEALQH